MTPGDWSIRCMIVVLILSLHGMYVMGDTTRVGDEIEIVLPDVEDTISGDARFQIMATGGSGKVASVKLLISDSGGDWKVLGVNQSVDNYDHVNITFDSTAYPDGSYMFLAEARDGIGNSWNTTGGPYTIFNPDAPLIVWRSPLQDDVISGNHTVEANISGYDGGLEGNPELFIRSEGGQWSAAGSMESESDSEIFRMVLDTGSYRDGNYSLRICATTNYSVEGCSRSGMFSIDNRYEPIVEISSPGNGDLLEGVVTMEGICQDGDSNINSDGLVFSYSTGDSGPRTKIGSTGNKGVCSVEWDTTDVENGDYTIFAEAWDLDDPPNKGLDTVEVKIRNDPKIVDVTDGGRTDDGWAIGVVTSGTPLAYPVDFYVDIFLDGQWSNWQNRTLDGPMDEVKPNGFTLEIGTNGLPEGNISVRIRLKDRYDLGDSLQRDDLFRFYPLLTPELHLERPDGEYISGDVWIRASVMDDDIPLTGPVRFYYSRDNSSWTMIGSGTYHRDYYYRVEWDTSSIDDWEYYHIKANYTDSDGLTGVAYTGDIRVLNDPGEQETEEEKEKSWYEKPRTWLYVLVVAVFIGVLIAISISLFNAFGRAMNKRRRRREREKARKELKKRSAVEHKRRSVQMDHLVKNKSYRKMGSTKKYGPSGTVPLKPGEGGISNEMAARGVKGGTTKKADGSKKGDQPLEIYEVPVEERPDLSGLKDMYSELEKD